MSTEQIHTDVREDPDLRAGFFALARETFDLDFEPWYRGGWWGERYIPYLLTVDGSAAANVSVNVLDTRFQGLPRRYIQLGTVMTAPAFRGRGYSRRLLETVLDRWRDRCDGVYLYANDSVLDFYPKFGFRPGVETVHSRPFSGGRGTARPLDVDRREDLDLLLDRYALGNPFCELPMLDNRGFLMFYCGSFLKDCVRYLPDLRCAAVAEERGETLVVHDLFCPPETDLEAALAGLAGPDIRRVELGFTPLDPDGWEAAPLREEDTTLFVLAGREDPFSRLPCRMPSLSHG